MLAFLVLSQLAALAQAAAARPAPALNLELERREDRLVVTVEGEPFTELHFGADLQKPYLHPLLGPGGVPLTRSWPMAEAPDEARDHPHHTSLWLAHGDVNGHDFWHGGQGEQKARIVLRELTSLPEPGPHTELSIVAVLDWIGADGSAVCTEERTLVFRASAEERTVDFESRLGSEDHAVRFGDTKEGTWAIRMRPELRLRGPVAAGRAVNSAGARDRDVWGKRAAWIAYGAEIEGTPFTVAMMDHPRSASHPTWWHARDYGLCAANPFGVHDFEGLPDGTGDRVVAPGETLLLAYRLSLGRGPVDPAQLDAAWRRYADSDR